MKANKKFKEEEEAVSAVIGVILMVAITVAIAATVYVYVSGMLGGPTATGPKISWTPNPAEDTLTITKGAPGSPYGASATSGNLIFINATSVKFYVQDDMSIAITTADLEEGDISAGDILTGFVDGMKYTLLWSPTDEVLGTVQM